MQGAMRGNHQKNSARISDKFLFLDHIIPSSPSSNEGGIGDGNQDGILAIAIMVGKSLIKPEMILLILGFPNSHIRERDQSYHLIGYKSSKIFYCWYDLLFRTVKRWFLLWDDIWFRLVEYFFYIKGKNRVFPSVGSVGRSACREVAPPFHAPIGALLFIAWADSFVFPRLSCFS